MSLSHAAKTAEIDRNLDQFLRVLPSLISEHKGQYVLLRHGAVLEFFASALDAQIAGNQRFEDEVFSIQHVTEMPEELGYFSYALRRG